MSATTATHATCRLEQVPSPDRMRYPTSGRWVCDCGATATVRAPWGQQTDASLSAWRSHAERARTGVAA